ncbi:MAG: YdeI/OmpD-associated family protein [Planctomycetota bacterium]
MDSKANNSAFRRFEALAPSKRRRYFAWIESAKCDETKLRPLKEAIRLFAGGKVLGLK